MPLRNLANEKKLTTRVLLYGKPGAGKTTAAKYLPDEKPFMLSLDNSFKRIPEWAKNPNVWMIDGYQPWEDIQDFTRYFKQNMNKYDALIVDNLTNFEQIIFTEFARLNSRSKLDLSPRDYGIYNRLMERMLGWLTSLPMDVLFTCWEEVDSITNNAGNTQNVIRPALRPIVRTYLEGNCDIVGRITAKPDGARGVYLLGTPDIDAKNRIDSRKGCLIQNIYKFETSESKPEPNAENESESALSSQEENAEESD